MASTTKIMTATIVLEKGNLNDTIEISKKAASTGGSRLGLKTGDKITVCDLLYGLMLCSGNDAAVALAEHIGGSIEGFAELMNKKAIELNLNNTHFVTPHGLDEDEHYTTAYELALLSNYAMKNQKFAQIVNTKNYTVAINGYSKNLHNTNELLGNLDGVYGIKTGFTNGANRCLVTACKRDNLDIICVVLGADTKKFRTIDSIKLIEYVFSNFEIINIENSVNNSFEEWKKTNINSFNINKGSSKNIDLKLDNFKYSTIPIKKEEVKDLKIEIFCNFNLNAPISENTSIGSLVVKSNNSIIYTTNIYTDCNITKKGILEYLNDFYTNYLSILESVIN